jgi:predicted DsbA family dithiol-disulfide isomerase
LAELAAADPELTINWRAFELRPEPVEMLDPNGEYLTRAWRNHVYPLAARIGLLMKKPPIQPRSRLAHEAAKWSGSKGRLAEYNVALFRALFQFGRDIGSRQVLLELAGDLGLDREDLAGALAHHRFAPAVIADEQEARRLGIRAVPSFVVGNRILASGVQTAVQLRELMARVPSGLSLSQDMLQ